MWRCVLYRRPHFSRNLENAKAMHLCLFGAFWVGREAISPPLTPPLLLRPLFPIQNKTSVLSFFSFLSIIGQRFLESTRRKPAFPNASIVLNQVFPSPVYLACAKHRATSLAAIWRYNETPDISRTGCNALWDVSNSQTSTVTMEYSCLTGWLIGLPHDNFV